MYLFLPPFSFSLTLLLSLSLRLPFYILFVYIGFIYIPVVGTWRLHWAPGLTGALGRAAASGITGMLFYAPFDLAGAKFLWWTWHDNDAAVDARWCGVPVGSTMWTLVHGFCFHMLVYWCGVYEPLEIPAAIAKQVDVRSMKNAAAAVDAAAAATAALEALSEGSKKVAKRKKKATKSATPPRSRRRGHRRHQYHIDAAVVFGNRDGGGRDVPKSGFPFLDRPAGARPNSDGSIIKCGMRSRAVCHFRRWDAADDGCYGPLSDAPAAV